MKTTIFVLGIVGVLADSVLSASAPPDQQRSARLSTDALLTRVQRQTFKYFWEGAEPNSGMAFERCHVKDRSTTRPGRAVATGGSGFGLMALLVGVERGFVGRVEAIDRLDRIVGYLEKADRFHGVWPHWLDGETGKVIPFSTKDDGADLVETSFLAQGLLAVRQFLNTESPAERRLARRIDALWREIEWDWFRRDNQSVLYWHWSPNFGWQMNHPLRGYNECLITYVLAASSPTHSIPPEVYHAGWARDGRIVNGSNSDGPRLTLKHNGADNNGGPLFWAHYSYLGLDPRGLKDKYADYWQHNKQHVLLNRAHCVRNPHNYKGYGEDCWGLTASYSVDAYAAHCPRRDLGVIAPTAALSSFPYTPEYSLRAMEHFYDDLGDRLWGPYGFFDALSEHHNWVSDGYLAIDQGPIIVMIENYRTAFIWDLFMSCPEVRRGLKRLGFSFPGE